MRVGDLDTGTELLTAQQVAVRLGIRTDTWRAYVSRGYAPDADLYIGRSPLWSIETLDGWRADRQPG